MTDREKAVAAPITPVQLAEWEADFDAFVRYRTIVPASHWSGNRDPHEARAAYRHRDTWRERFPALIAEVRRLSDRVRTLEDWGRGSLRRIKPFPLSTRITDEPDESERASEPPETQRPAEEAPERADFAADDGYRARRV